MPWTVREREAGDERLSIGCRHQVMIFRRLRVSEHGYLETKESLVVKMEVPGMD
jgi:hypothetical protein